MALWLTLLALTLCLMVAGILAAIRKQLDEPTRSRLYAAQKDRHQIVHRLARRFMLLGTLAFALVLAHYLVLASHSVTQESYQHVLRQGVAVNGTVTQVKQPWYSCVGKPSVCSLSITVTDVDGILLVDNLLLDYGQTISEGSPIQLVSLGERYHPVAHRPFMMNDRVQMNSLILGLVCLLFLLIGVLMKAGFYFLSRE